MKLFKQNKIFLILISIITIFLMFQNFVSYKNSPVKNFTIKPGSIEETCYRNRYPRADELAKKNGKNLEWHWNQIGKNMGLIPDCYAKSNPEIKSNAYNFEGKNSCYFKRYPGIANYLLKSKTNTLAKHWNKIGKKNYLNPTCDPWDTENSVSQKLKEYSSFDRVCYEARYSFEISKWLKKNKKNTVQSHWDKVGYKNGLIGGCEGLSSQFISTYLDSIKNINVDEESVSIIGGGINPIEITLAPPFLGSAITGVWYKGSNLINNSDHGRQLQSAFQGDGYGECYNPTEAGSVDDGYISNESSSEVLKILKPSKNVLETSERMAFWSSGNNLTGACSKGLYPTAPLPILSDVELLKKVTIGQFGDPNIIKLEITFLPNKTFNEGTVFEILTGYLKYDLKNFGYLDSQLQFREFRNSDYESLVGQGFPSGSYHMRSSSENFNRPIVAYTTDGSLAMGVYFPPSQLNEYSSFDGYVLYNFNLRVGATTKWSLAVREDAVLSQSKQDNARSFVVYLSVASKNSAIESLKNAVNNAK